MNPLGFPSEMLYHHCSASPAWDPTPETSTAAPDEGDTIALPPQKADSPPRGANASHCLSLMGTQMGGPSRQNLSHTCIPGARGSRDVRFVPFTLKRIYIKMFREYAEMAPQMTKDQCESQSPFAPIFLFHATSLLAAWSLFIPCTTYFPALQYEAYLSSLFKIIQLLGSKHLDLNPSLFWDPASVSQPWVESRFKVHPSHWPQESVLASKHQILVLST